MARRTNYGICKATGKHRFRSEKDAAYALASTKKNAKRAISSYKRQERRYYECDLCDGWHLTSFAEPPKWTYVEEDEEPLRGAQGLF